MKWIIGLIVALVLFATIGGFIYRWHKEYPLNLRGPFDYVQFINTNEVQSQRLEEVIEVIDPFISTKDEDVNINQVESDENLINLITINFEEFTKDDIVGQGSFGKIYKFNFQSNFYAIKRFKKNDEASWQKEVSIHEKINKTPGAIVKHNGIVKYFGANKNELGVDTIYWTITEYCDMGSLSGHLKKNTLKPTELYRMIQDICSGIHYIHDCVKPSIAHMDIKSPNVLLNTGLKCVICDFGLAISEDDYRDHKESIGTLAYAAPEFLQRHAIEDERSRFEVFLKAAPHLFKGREQEEESPSLPLLTFDAFLKGDIYSFAILMWEMMNVTDFSFDQSTPELDGHAAIGKRAIVHKFPYSDLVTGEYDIDDYKEVICDKNMRPEINEEWLNDPTAKFITDSIVQSWSGHPDSRPSISSLHHKFSSLKF